MSNKIIRIDQLSDAIMEELENLNEQVVENVDKAAQKEARAGAKTLRSTSPVRHDGYARKHAPGSYAESWTSKSDGGGVGASKYVIYNKSHYQLAHLLEFGHIIAQTGDRSKAIPHIAPVNESVSSNFVKAVEGMKFK